MTDLSVAQLHKLGYYCNPCTGPGCILLEVKMSFLSVSFIRNKSHSIVQSTHTRVVLKKDFFQKKLCVHLLCRGGCRSVLSFTKSLDVRKRDFASEKEISYCLFIGIRRSQNNNITRLIGFSKGLTYITPRNITFLLQNERLREFLLQLLE